MTQHAVFRHIAPIRTAWLAPLRLLILALGMLRTLPAQALTAEEATRVGGDLTALRTRLANLQESVLKVIDAAPTAVQDWAATIGQVVASHSDDRSRLIWQSVLAVAILLIAMGLYRYATRRWRARFANDELLSRGAAAWLALELGEWCVLAAVAYGVIEAVFDGDRHGDLFIVAVLWTVIRWRLLMLLLDAVLRPRKAAYRLIHMDDRAAQQLKWLIGLPALVGILSISIMPVLLRAGLSHHAGQVIVLAQGLIVALGCLAALLRYRAAHQAAGNLNWIVRLWIALGALCLALVWMSWNLSVVTLEFSMYHSLVASLRIALFAYIVDTMLGLSSHAPWVKLAQRAITAAAVLAIGILLAQVWLVEELALVPEATWLPIRRSMISASLTLFIGYVAWRWLNHWTEVRLRAAAAGIGPEVDDEAVVPASRLTTALPMLRILAGLATLLTAGLIALSQLGVEIAPLLAGAGVFGLALSFGSQALVRDIMSGIFFMLDDAFRVGEYIDTGKLKGTVERISLRSVQLRHQNGQVHTIPYGQLTAITNFSRDWQTVKFTLRLARHVDLEKVRKCTKKIGQELTTDPDFGKEIILPLKMQGVMDVADNALIVRFKFTTKPGNPSWVQREYTKRLYKAFAEQGLEFASAAITVQTAGLTPGATPAAGAGAAASMAPEPTAGGR